MPSYEDLLSLSKILNKTDFTIISLSVLAAPENIKMLNLTPLPPDIIYSRIILLSLSFGKRLNRFHLLYHKFIINISVIVTIVTLSLF